MRVEDHRATRVDARPAPALRRYVGSYIGFDLRGFPAGVHCGPPGRVLTAVISLSDPLEVAAGVDGGAPVTRFGGVVGGLMSRSVAIHHDGQPAGRAGVADTARGSRRLRYARLRTRRPTGPARRASRSSRCRAGRPTPSGDDLGRAVRRAGRVAPASRRPRRGRRAPPRVRPEVAEAWRSLVAARGRVRVSAVAAELGWSRRYLTERFRDEVGLSPRTFARVLRFEYAHELATAHTPLPWADVAALSGYADQAHLVRDWGEFTGRSPTAWRRGEVLLGTG